MNRFSISPYVEQAIRWPQTGRHILAQFDDETILVYQAYNRSIAQFAIDEGHFGGDFSLSRMSWIKPNFLWMMYRSGWGTKENQEVILALRLRRTFFESLLAAAVASTFESALYASHDKWAEAVKESSVRLQWDPDHDPGGANLDRRAIQLGLRGKILEQFALHELIEVIDLTEFVADQRLQLRSPRYSSLLTPTERLYKPSDPKAAKNVGLSELW